MRRIFDITLLIATIFVAGFVYLYHDELSVKARTLVYGAPCSRPVTYSLGALDPRFKLTEDEVLNIINQAALAWNKVSGKNLLSYENSGGKVIVNFSYDRRQEVTEELQVLDVTLAENTSAYQELKSKLDLAKSVYDSHKLAFETHKLEVYKIQQDYNKEVSLWNKKGGAPKNIYQRLEKESAALKEEYAKLQNEADALNEEVRRINSLVRDLNGAADAHNTNANAYNKVSSSVPSEFREGEYIEDSSGKKINIYQFNDENKLLRVLEHEFGHALNLDHVEDSEAIMYTLNIGQSLMPTAADLVELANVCSGKKVLVP